MQHQSVPTVADTYAEIVTLADAADEIIIDNTNANQMRIVFKDAPAPAADVAAYTRIPQGESRRFNGPGTLWGRVEGDQAGVISYIR